MTTKKVGIIDYCAMLGNNIEIKERLLLFLWLY